MNALHEGAEIVGESGKTYLAVSPLGQANVWTAVQKDDHGNIVVLKAPSSDDKGVSWPRFQHEMIMHELFKDCESIRKQVDRIPPVPGTNGPPMLVLEIAEMTLWHARAKRSFSNGEIKAVARAILTGLQEVHDQGLVYADLKMHNVMLSGFEPSKAGDGDSLITTLGDLGIVMSPCKGTAQPVAYRAPEVYFKGEITLAADIWAFGLIYCHLLEARHRFSKTGLYDDLYTGNGTMPEREQAMRYAIANDYDIRNVDYYKDCTLPYRDEARETGSHWEELRKRGLDEDEIEFLQWILRSDPTERPTAKAILESRWLMIDGSAASHTTPATNGVAQSEDGEDTRSSKRSRRGTYSKTPGAFRPLSELDFSSLVPPVFTPSGTGAFDFMVDQRSESRSPIKDHPLVANITAHSSIDEQVNGDIAAEQSSSVNEQAAAGAATAEDEPVESKHEGAVPVVQPTSPERPSFLGRNSSTGGTYLSYQ